jgi:hypothetical protein
VVGDAAGSQAGICDELGAAPHHSAIRIPRISAADFSMFRMVVGSTVPSRSTSRVRATARMPRQIATLSTSTPSVGEIAGRSGVPERELDTGTIATSSSAAPLSNPSADITTAGRCLPGSPGREAPRLTSHSSPRRGSANAVLGRGLPVLFFVADGGGRRLAAFGLAFGLEHRVALGDRGQLRQQGCEGDSPLTRLGREEVTGPYGDPDCRRRCRHVCSLTAEPSGQRCPSSEPTADVASRSAAGPIFPIASSSAADGNHCTSSGNSTPFG